MKRIIRWRTTAFSVFAQQLFQLGAGWVLPLASLPIFSRLADGKPDLPNGMRYVSIVLALITVALGVLPGIFVPERYYARESSKQARQPLWAGIKQTFATKPFRWVLGIVISYTFGFGLVSALGFYVNAYYVCQGDVGLAAKIQGAKFTLLFAPNIFMIPLCTWLGSRFGKRVLLYISAISGIVGTLSIFIFYTPAHPWLQLIPPLLISPVSMGLWLVVPSMQADVADYDELQTGKRREGSFAAMFSWTFKASTTVTTGLSGMVLVWTGFNIHNGAIQPAHVLAHLKLFYIAIPLGFLFFCLYAISRYDLTRERMREVRSQLEARRGVI
jgi:glycoside/pentoside/hexuronide:cation symporter, GPH family